MAKGCVSSLIRRGQELRAEVAGSQFAPYGVRVVFDEAGISGASCGCPYDWGGLCKHIVATLLASLQEPESASAFWPDVGSSREARTCGYTAYR